MLEKLFKRPEKIFASKAKENEMTDNFDIERGWGFTAGNAFIPALEEFNYLQNRTDLDINYLLQQGVAEWEENTQYYKGSVASYEGLIYLANEDNKAAIPANNSKIWSFLLDSKDLEKINDKFKEVDNNLAGKSPSNHTHNYAGSSSAGGKANSALIADKATIWATARNLQIGNTAKSVNGSANVSWSLDEIGTYSKSKIDSLIKDAGGSGSENSGTQSLSENGYIRIGNAILQWGTVKGKANFPFPIAFPNNVLSIAISGYASMKDGYTGGEETKDKYKDFATWITQKSKTSAYIKSDNTTNSAPNITYIAIGY